MATQTEIKIDSEVKDRLNMLARMEGRTPNRSVRELIEDCIKERDTHAYIDDLCGRIGGKLGPKDLKQRDINRVIEEARKANR